MTMTTDPTEADVRRALDQLRTKIDETQRRIDASAVSAGGHPERPQFTVIEGGVAGNASDTTYDEP